MPQRFAIGLPQVKVGNIWGNLSNEIREFFIHWIEPQELLKSR